MSHIDILYSTTCYIYKDAAESDIRAAFSEHGTVAKIQMPLDRNTVSYHHHMILQYVVFLQYLLSPLALYITYT